jgi:hypothetical protein
MNYLPPLLLACHMPQQRSLKPWPMSCALHEVIHCLEEFTITTDAQNVSLLLLKANFNYLQKIL